MTRRDTPYPDGGTEDENTYRSRSPRPPPSNVVDLGTDVGTESSGPLSTEFDVREPPPSGRDGWELVCETSRRPALGSRQRSHPAGGSERYDGPPDVDYSARTYRAEDALAVIAELPGVDEEDLSTGIDVRSNRFVVSVRGRTVDRIPLPWDSTAVAVVRFDDGVLEARLEPAERGGFETDRERCV